MTEQRRASRVRRLIPWLVGIAIVVVIGLQVPFARFRDSFTSGPHLQLAVVELLLTVAAFATDSIATWISLRTVNIRWSLSRVAAIRGATYLLVVLNYAVGQGGFGYYLYRAGEPAKRALGITLYLLGTTLVTLFIVTFAIWLAADGRSANEQMWWTLVGTMAAFAVYLAIIATRVRFFAGREVFAPLFEAHLKGHLIAILSRIPHVAATVFAHWVAMIVWGIELPAEVAVVYMPAVALAAVLPISPAGLGTMQAAMVYFFAAYASGATSEERTANLLGFGVAHYVYAVVFTVVVGLVCLPFAKRTGLMTGAPR